MITYPPTTLQVASDRTSGLARLAGGLSAGPMSRLRALVLLSGVMRTTGWISDIDRSALDLPIDSRRSLLAHWFEHAARLAAVAGVQRFAMEVRVGRSSPMPDARSLSAKVHETLLSQMRVERDPADYRGTGGVLRDLSLRYDDDDFLLVATGAQILTRPLEELVGILASRSTDVAIVGHDNGTPAGLIWIRCGCLRTIPELGFVDLKEQALTQIAREHRVEVVRLSSAGMTLRTPADYVRAVRQFHLCEHSDGRLDDPFAEDWRPTVSLVEGGSEVDATARIHDSVVLRGGRVERDAVVVRSLVGPRGCVRRGQYVIDQFVNGTSRSRE